MPFPRLGPAELRERQVKPLSTSTRRSKPGPKLALLHIAGITDWQVLFLSMPIILLSLSVLEQSLFFLSNNMLEDSEHKARVTFPTWKLLEVTADKNQSAQDNVPAASAPDTSACNNQNDNNKLRLMALPPPPDSPPSFSSISPRHFWYSGKEPIHTFCFGSAPQDSLNTASNRAPSLIWMVKVHVHLHIDRVPDTGFCHLPKTVLIVSSHSTSSCCEWGIVAFAQYQYVPPSRHPNCKHVQVNAFSPTQLLARVMNSENSKGRDTEDMKKILKQEKSLHTHAPRLFIQRSWTILDIASTCICSFCTVQYETPWFESRNRKGSTNKSKELHPWATVAIGEPWQGLRTAFQGKTQNNCPASFNTCSFAGISPISSCLTMICGL